MSVVSSAHRLAYTIPVFSETRLLDHPSSINLSLVKYFSIEEGSGERYFDSHTLLVQRSLRS